MIDSYARRITYLRLSVTDRCDFRCAYCMAEDMVFLPKKDILTLDELLYICDTFMDMGIRKIRVTGGEPLVRKNVLWLFEQLANSQRQGKLEEITVTTNGSMLEKYADSLVKFGVKRINVSLDTLQEQTFSTITRSNKYHQVIRGIEYARRVGLKIKLNTVALKGINESCLADMVSYAIEKGFDITFIEVMPMGDLGNENRLQHFLPLTEVKKQLGAVFALSPSVVKTNGPSTYYTIKGVKDTKIGFIAPLSHNFCANCNRLRLTCTGVLYPCLGQENRVELLPIVRQNMGKSSLRQAIAKAVAEKPKHHDFVISKQSQVSVSRHMNVTGG